MASTRSKKHKSMKRIEEVLNSKTRWLCVCFLILWSYAKSDVCRPVADRSRPGVGVTGGPNNPTTRTCQPGLVSSSLSDMPLILRTPRHADGTLAHSDPFSSMEGSVVCGTGVRPLLKRRTPLLLPGPRDGCDRIHSHYLTLPHHC